MKKKKSLKIVIVLFFWLIVEFVHNWLSRIQVIVRNYGVSFGFEGRLFLILNIFFVVFLTITWFKNTLLGIGLIMVGGWVNFIDRVAFGYVRDYWQLGYFYNNLADWLIQIGVIIFLSRVWIKKLK